jgi:phosphoglycerol transferase MdoB-like AlkP superfamily enzyme
MLRHCGFLSYTNLEQEHFSVTHLPQPYIFIWITIAFAALVLLPYLALNGPKWTQKKTGKLILTTLSILLCSTGVYTIFYTFHSAPIH